MFLQTSSNIPAYIPADIFADSTAKHADSTADIAANVPADILIVPCKQPCRHHAVNIADSPAIITTTSCRHPADTTVDSYFKTSRSTIT